MKKISNLIESDSVVIFMKGSPDFPQCGFSAQVVDILNFLGVKFSSYNVLDDNELRDGIKNIQNGQQYRKYILKKNLLGAVTYS